MPEANKTFTENDSLRVMTAEELLMVSKLVRFRDIKTVGLDLAVEVHDSDGILLGTVRQHEDWGYAFFAEKGGKL